MLSPRPSNDDRRRRGWRIALAGTGGQGVLTAARVLCDVFTRLGHEVVSGQLHGMAQRGGSVQSSVMVDAGISPVIPGGAADFVLGLEPAETARALPLMSPATLVFMNVVPVVPYVLTQRLVREQPQAGYPDVDDLVQRVRAVAGEVHAFEATAVAIEAGSLRTLNMVMVGCLLGAGTLPCTADRFWETVTGTIPPPLADANTRAFYDGVAVSRKLQLAEAES
ncbi:MAG: indolepyruvate oxidoreductase subunit beta [Planctomycetota bacterium]